MAAKVKVLIVDDSALIRQLLTRILESSSEIEVVGAARDPLDARDKIKQLNPDVLTLDVEMPKMDGITFLKNLMRLRPMPVVMISTLTEAGADVTLEALEIGAVDFISKPKVDVQDALSDYAELIIEKVLMAAKARVREYRQVSKSLQVDKKLSADVVLKKQEAIRFRTTDKIVAIGASTGGTEAIREVLVALPANAPGIVISQHIPVAFSAAFTERVNRQSQINVLEPRDGDKILPGHAYIAPGDRHLIVERSGANYYICRLNDGPPVNRHKPSVDVMFRSVAQNVGPNAMGVMLTGMGADGAQGMLEMKQQGAYNVSQDEQSCVVWGMPGAAVKLGAVDKELNLSNIAQEIMQYCSK